MLQYLACSDWVDGTGDNSDYVQLAGDVLTACRGIIILVEQDKDSNSDRRSAFLQSRSLSLPNLYDGFQFCRQSARVIDVILDSS